MGLEAVGFSLAPYQDLREVRHPSARLIQLWRGLLGPFQYSMYSFEAPQ